MADWMEDVTLSQMGEAEQRDPDHRPELCDCGRRHDRRSVYNTYTGNWECAQCWVDFVDCPEI